MKSRSIVQDRMFLFVSVALPIAVVSGLVYGSVAASIKAEQERQMNSFRITKIMKTDGNDDIVCKMLLDFKKTMAQEPVHLGAFEYCEKRK